MYQWTVRGLLLQHYNGMTTLRSVEYSIHTWYVFCRACFKWNGASTLLGLG